MISENILLLFYSSKIFTRILSLIRSELKRDRLRSTLGVLGCGSQSVIGWLESWHGSPGALGKTL